MSIVLFVLAQEIGDSKLILNEQACFALTKAHLLYISL